MIIIDTVNRYNSHYRIKQIFNNTMQFHCIDNASYSIYKEIYSLNNITEESCIFIFYKNGKRHRANGPAVIGNKAQEWWFEGKLHREDGPAVTTKSGNETYYLNDKRLSKNEFLNIKRFGGFI